MRVTARRIAAALLATATTLALAGCSGDDDGDGGGDDPQAQLDTAADLLNEASSVRFTVEGEDLPDDGTVVLGAEGVAVPPASFEGDIRIRAGALPATVAVVSVDGQLWAQLPLTNGFAEVDAEELGFGDPGLLIDPDEGVSQLLTSGSEVTAGDQVRIDGEVYDQVESVLPGELVGRILAIADPTAEVQAVWALDSDSGHLRQATLTGPFYEGGDEQSYSVQLDDYDEPAEISAPDS
ncbi:LppX_LprAFG lipoprotein [Jiangella asiatica]|uniref:LppX_LprAFG lipoprotein n=1 Tax=Jiangella asiatica TaxID=2530372 RepID=A0A4R5CIL2_9ACTN|nr:LppX_LprAFG lipoprotein [Jiangella asiatica]TDE00089.1 LppX_LprAFG lipoprotein [Jiangella asiatica]